MSASTSSHPNKVQENFLENSPEETRKHTGLTKWKFN